MTKLVQYGVERPKEPPPTGALGVCPRCGATVEVEEIEEFLPVVYEDPDSLRCYAGWLVVCCVCQYPRVPIRKQVQKKKKNAA